MAPVKFDDIPKTASSILGDDYQEKGYCLKTKQPTTWNGTSFSGSVDIVPSKDGVWTPAKLTWKFPKPLGFDQVCVDKLEMDKAGNLKLEVSSDRIAPGVKVTAASDLKDPAKVSASCTYTGIKDTQLKLDTKPMKPKDFTFEATYAHTLSSPGASATVGLKGAAATLMTPDVGCRFALGDYFCSLLVKEKFKVFQLHGFYSVTAPLKLACSYTHGGKATGAFTLGLAYEVMKGTKVKAKVSQDKSLSASVKYDISKGLNVIAGGKTDTKGNYTYGLQLSVE